MKWDTPDLINKFLFKVLIINSSICYTYSNISSKPVTYIELFTESRCNINICTLVMYHKHTNVLNILIIVLGRRCNSYINILYVYSYSLYTIIFTEMGLLTLRFVKFSFICFYLYIALKTFNSSSWINLLQIKIDEPRGLEQLEKETIRL